MKLAKLFIITLLTFILAATFAAADANIEVVGGDATVFTSEEYFIHGAFHDNDGPAAIIFSEEGPGYSPVTIHEKACNPSFDDCEDTVGPITKTTPGDYEYVLEGVDSTGKQYYDSVTVTVELPNLAPTASFTYSPLNPVIYESVSFDASSSSDPNSDPLTYSWDFESDGVEDAAGETTSAAFQEPGTYPVTLTVSDGVFTDSVTTDLVVRAFLDIASISCYENVSVGGNQSCIVEVVDDNGGPVGDADVTVYYESTGNVFGTCTTNGLTGKCSAKDIQDSSGQYTVHATADKTDYVSDDSMDETFTYNVLSLRYDVVNLAVYNSSNFGVNDEDYDFYRGENLYVRFQVFDFATSSWVESDIVASAVLESMPGGRAELSDIGTNNGWFMFELTPIPATHDFLGDSQVFAFVFNFTDASAGQEQVSLIIRNSPPEISNLGNFTVQVNTSETFDLSGYASDLEDSDSDLFWEVEETSSMFEASANGQILTIDGLQEGVSQMTLRLFDLDGDFASQTVMVNVTSEPVVTTGPTAVIDADPISGDAPLNVSFDASQSTGSGLRYVWTYLGNVISSAVNFIYEFINPGTHQVTLTVTDDQNRSDSASVDIVVTAPDVPDALESGRSGLIRDSLYIGRIGVFGSNEDSVEPGDYLIFKLGMDNRFSEDFEDLRVSVYVHELGIEAHSKSFDLDDEASHAAYLFIPEDAQPGWYYAKIVVENGDGVRRVKHRDFKIG